ncbi:MAG: crossover junction endodeoxyribonuclease RuvC [Caldimicrobium sp.]|nr:crossover junction endodeoxyribonuclease RuvC [Caldimicrobium sp.]
MRIIGIDPGLLHLGVVIIEKQNSWEILYALSLKTCSSQSPSKRLHSIFIYLRETFQIYNPSFLVFEETIPKANPYQTSQITQVCALIMVLAEENRIPYKTYSPTHWRRYLCGNGRAKRADLLKVLENLLGGKIGAKIKDEHILDALGLAITYALEQGIF